MPAQYPGNSTTKAARAKAGGGFESAIESAASFVPMVKQDFSALTLGDPVAGWSRSSVSDAASVSGGKSLRLSTDPGFPPPTCGGSNYFAGRQALPAVVTEGYTVWQRMWMYFPSSFSFGYTFFVRDTTSMASAAAGGATSISINPPASTPLADGQALYITLDDATQHFTRVNGGADIVGGQVSLLDALPSAASAGNQVKTYDEAEASFCGKPNDGGTTGIKWLVFAPDSGTRRMYTKIGNSRRAINQPSSPLLNFENEAGGNANGTYAIPRDQWVCFQMAVKVASDTTGFARIWINDQLKAEALNIKTIESADGATGISAWGLGDYWNGLPWSDGGAGRTDFYIDDLIVASDMPNYGAPTGVDAAGNAYIDPATRVGDLV